MVWKRYSRSEKYIPCGIWIIKHGKESAPSIRMWCLIVYQEKCNNMRFELTKGKPYVYEEERNSMIVWEGKREINQRNAMAIERPSVYSISKVGRFYQPRTSIYRGVNIKCVRLWSIPWCLWVVWQHRLRPPAAQAFIGRQRKWSIETETNTGRKMSKTISSQRKCKEKLSMTLGEQRQRNRSR